MHSPHDIAPILAACFGGVLQASWQGSLAIGLVLLVRRAFGSRVPVRWHYLLWFLVIARLLLPTFALPHSPVSLENIPAVAHPFVHSLPARPAAVSVDGSDSAPGMTRSPASLSVNQAVPPDTTPLRDRRLSWSWWTPVAAVWLAGVLLLGGGLAACAARLHRRLQRESFPVEEPVAAIWRGCCEHWLRRTPPSILAADWIDSPALVGWWQPTLLLPRRSLAAFSAEDWEHVFAHEIAHLRWRDHWSQALVLAAWCVHWFNPVVWLGFRRLRADRELAADEWVLRRLESERALAYGETLFKTLANRPAPLAFQPGMVGISEDGAQMKQRLGRIAAFLPHRRVMGSLAGSGVALLLATMVLGQGTSEPVASPVPQVQADAIKPAATPAAPSLDAMAAEARDFFDRLLAAARAGDTVKTASLVNATYGQHAVKFSEDTATRMLDTLVRQRELTAFMVMHDQLKQTTYGKDWKLNDELLASLVKDGRTDFLDALLDRRLDLKRLGQQAPSADAATAAWIARRVPEVTKQRADISALEAAAKKGDLPAIQRLIDAGVDVNAYGSDNDTALVKAADSDHLEAAQLLLDHGALVDRPRSPGWDYTPLCLCHSVPMAELLKKAGANLHAKLWKRDTEIMVCVVQWSTPEVVEWFLQQGIDPKMLGDNGETLLFNVKSVEMAKVLLVHGVDPNQVSAFGTPPITTARNAEIAQTLIDHGAKVTGFKEPLLPNMITFGSGGAMEAILKVGADQDPVMLQKAIITAAHMNKGDMIQVLIKHGADPNAPGIFSSKTDQLLPLEACCIWGGVKAAKALLEAGADPNNPKAKRPFVKHAMHNGYKELAILLRQAGARGVSDLSFAIATQDKDKIKALVLVAPAYADDPAFWDDVPGSAARVGDVETVRAALAKGVPVVVDPLAKAEDPYAVAAGEGQHEALAVLLATRRPGANPDELRWALWEAVWNGHPYASQRSAEHFERCVRMLLDAGTPVNGDDGDKHERNLVTTAIFTRFPGGNANVLEMLVRAGADPNPPVATVTNPHAHLLEAVQEACTQGNCSTPLAETLIRLNQLAPPRPAPSLAVPVTAAPKLPAENAKQSAASPAPATPASQGIETSVSVSMADGTPLGGEPIMFHVFSSRGAGGTFGSNGPVKDGSFFLRLDAGTITATAAVEQRGCAPVYVGPFDAGNLDKFKDLQIRLTHGHPAAVQVVDEVGKPIAGARLRAYHPGPPAVDLDEAATDAAGGGTIEHVGEPPLNIRVLADGFQADEVTGLHLDPARPYRWTLKPNPPLPGTVVSLATGQPIAGAVIKLAGVRGPHDETCYEPEKASRLTATDAQGRFVLGSLRPDSRYYLFVEAPGYGGAYLQGVTLAQGELKVALGPELSIRGRIIHAPASVIHLGKVHLQYGQTLNFGGNYSAVASKSVDLTPVNGEAEFSIGPFYKVFGEAETDANRDRARGGKPVGIYVDSWGVASFGLDQLPVSDFVFDLARKSNTRDAPEAAD